MLVLLEGLIVPPRARLFVVIFLMSCELSVIARSFAGQFTSEVSLVEVYASVTDSAGTPVSGLTANEFLVEEDGEPQPISAFAAGAMPLALAIGVDRSFSVSRDRLREMTSAVTRFLEELRPEDLTMLLAVGSQVETLAPLDSSREPIRAALARLQPWGTTPLYDATAAAVDALQPARGRRALILMSDGEDRYSRMSAAEAVSHVRARDVLVYPVALGRKPPAIFAELASVTGGRSFLAADNRALSSALSAVARELRAQYLIGYVPVREHGQGWRSIRVTATRPGVRVRARDGYYARP
jgi:Ca-activated chloride channel family protein